MNKSTYLSPRHLHSRSRTMLTFHRFLKHWERVKITKNIMPNFVFRTFFLKNNNYVCCATVRSLKLLCDVSAKIPLCTGYLFTYNAIIFRPLWLLSRESRHLANLKIILLWPPRDYLCFCVVRVKVCCIKYNFLFFFIATREAHSTFYANVL